MGLNKSPQSNIGHSHSHNQMSMSMSKSKSSAINSSTTPIKSSLKASPRPASPSSSISSSLCNVDVSKRSKSKKTGGSSGFATTPRLVMLAGMVILVQMCVTFQAYLNLPEGGMLAPSSSSSSSSSHRQHQQQYQMQMQQQQQAGRHKVHHHAQHNKRRTAEQPKHALNAKTSGEQPLRRAVRDMVHKVNGIVTRTKARASKFTAKSTSQALFMSQFPNSIYARDEQGRSLGVSLKSTEEEEVEKEGQWQDIFHPGKLSSWRKAHGMYKDVQLEVMLGDTAKKANLETLRVPKFWKPDPALFGPADKTKRQWEGGRLMTKQQALLLGTKITLPYTPTTTTLIPPQQQQQPQPDSSSTQGNILMETIYVAVASYRDDQCIHTVANLFRRATYPQRIRVGIVDQIDLSPESTDAHSGVRCAIPPLSACQDLMETFPKPLLFATQDALEQDMNQDPEEDERAMAMVCHHRALIDVFTMDASLAVGPTLARHVGHRMYRNEYFAMQVDAHVRFTQDWDVDLVMQWRATKNEMAVLTTYLSDVEGLNATTGMRLYETRPIMCNTIFEQDEGRYYLRNDQQPEAPPSVTTMPQIQPYWAAGFSFSRGHFLLNVPYDAHFPMMFQGEESNIGLRGFSQGYDLYAPLRSVCFHIYGIGRFKKQRHKIKKFWENGDLYPGVGVRSLDRLLGIVDMLPFGGGAGGDLEVELEEEEEEVDGEQQEQHGNKKNKQNKKKNNNEKRGVHLQHKKQKTYHHYAKKIHKDPLTLAQSQWDRIELQTYGLGTVRSVQTFYKTFGIHVETHSVEENLCDFVSEEKTHGLFQAALREDGMGIDYGLLEGVEYRDGWTLEHILRVAKEKRAGVVVEREEER